MFRAKLHGFKDVAVKQLVSATTSTSGGEKTAAIKAEIAILHQLR